MTVARFIVIRGIVKATLSLCLVASLCYAVLFTETTGEGIALLAGLVGVILQHYFQRDADSPPEEALNGGSSNTEEDN